MGGSWAVSKFCAFSGSAIALVNNTKLIDDQKGQVKRREASLLTMTAIRFHPRNRGCNVRRRGSKYHFTFGTYYPSLSFHKRS